MINYFEWFCLAAESGCVEPHWEDDYGSSTTYDGTGYGDGDYGHTLGTVGVNLGHGKGTLIHDE